MLAKLVALMNEMLDVADKKRNGELELSVTCLTRMTGFGMNDVMILCGNGSGVGAIKIGRGMFETSLLAEYLRRNPNEVSDYVDFGPVLAWRRLQTLRGKKRQGMAPEMVKQLEDEYNSVKGRFLNSKGNVRSQWTTKKISQMAEELGRSDQYALVYGLACSLHHANFEGLMGHCDTKNGRLKMDRCGSHSRCRIAPLDQFPRIRIGCSKLPKNCGKVGRKLGTIFLKQMTNAWQCQVHVCHTTLFITSPAYAVKIILLTHRNSIIFSRIWEVMQDLVTAIVLSTGADLGHLIQRVRNVRFSRALSLRIWG